MFHNTKPTQSRLSVFSRSSELPAPNVQEWLEDLIFVSCFNVFMFQVLTKPAFWSCKHFKLAIHFIRNKPFEPSQDWAEVKDLPCEWKKKKRNQSQLFEESHILKLHSVFNKQSVQLPARGSFIGWGASKNREQDTGLGLTLGEKATQSCSLSILVSGAHHIPQ